MKTSKLWRPQFWRGDVKCEVAKKHKNIQNGRCGENGERGDWQGDAKYIGNLVLSRQCTKTGI